MEKETTHINRIAIVGPESTGKSWLSESLANHYKTWHVPEYAREYIGNLNRKYTLNDIELIAKKQLENENMIAKKASRFLFCDTTLLVTKIWAEFVFETCPTWINKHYQPNNYTHHLLCDIDLPWQDDPQREHENKRLELFKLYHQSLINTKTPFTIINGQNQQRLDCAIRAIENLNIFTKTN
jgi:NadR type nicotinamide-nucleotide adenylyltransferase